MTDTLISVIIPIFNAEKYLNRCLDSVVNQSYRNIEIILINDGSTDGSECICRSYAEKDNRIKLINQSNSGQSAVRNKGIDISSGEYIYFMDSDDYIETNAIELAMNELKKNNADLFIWNYHHLYADGVRKEEREFKEGTYEISEEEDKYDFLLNVFLPYKCGFEVWNRLYDARLIRENHIEFPLFNPMVAEDVCFNLLYILCASKVIVTNNRLYNYVHHDDSTIAVTGATVQVNKYNEIGVIGYNFLKNANKNPFIFRNYVFVHVLLLYHELMFSNLKEMKTYIKSIEDGILLGKLLKINPMSIITGIGHMGMARGIKYSILALLYKKWIKKNHKDRK